MPDIRRSAWPVRPITRVRLRDRSAIKVPVCRDQVDARQSLSVIQAPIGGQAQLATSGQIRLSADMGVRSLHHPIDELLDQRVAFG